MTTMDLGAIKKNRADFGPLAEMVGAMRDEITREVLADVLSQRQSLITEVAQIVADAIARSTPPHVEVRAAQPAHNTVNLPEMRPVINVDIPGDDEQAEVDAIDRNTEALRALTTQVQLLHQLLSRPVTKDVERDSNGQITRVTETR